MAAFLDRLAGQGFRLTERRSNCLWLPADERLAAHSGAALHRGPHPQYSDLVAARVDRIRSRCTAQDAPTLDLAMRRLRRQQRALARTLLGRTPRLITLNRRDPMRLFADYSVLDAAIEQMAGEQMEIVIASAAKQSRAG